MRRIFLFVCILMFVCLSASGLTGLVTAHAGGTEYLLISGDNISLYANNIVPAALFTLPKTFYVKVITKSVTPDYHIVEYNGVRGLVKVSEVGSDTIENVSNPYYTAQTITPHINTKLYASPSFSAETEVDASGLSLTYLGKVNGDKGSYDTSVWFAVLYANEPYYLHCSLTNNLSLLESTFAPVHPNSVNDTSTVSTGTETADEAPEGHSFDTVRLLLIIGMIVPAVIILFLLFKPKKRRATPKRARRYPDEDDYDDYYDD